MTKKIAKEYLIDNAQLMAEWSWTQNKNLGIDVYQVTVGSERKAWWTCQKCGESYFTSIYSRASLGTGCPVCANRVVRIGVNDLSTTNPEIAKQWHPTKNGTLRATDVVSGSNKRIWWCCEEGHEWLASVNDRRGGRSCPFCATKKRPVSRQKTYLTKSGSLASRYPQIAKQWHPSKNGNLTPEQITPGSKHLAWWICEKGHEWEAVTSSRTAGRGCPYCNNEHCTSFPEQIIFFYLSQVTNAVNRYRYKGKELDIYLPVLNIGIEYNGRYYHKNRKQQDEEKSSFFQNQGIRVMVIYEGDHASTSGDTIYYQYTNSEYLNLCDVVLYILRQCGLPTVDVNIKRDRAKIYEQFLLQEKASSIGNMYPWLIDEWDYERNGKLTPWKVSYGSKKRIHWICKVCGYRWESVVYSRKKCGCPCCANRVVVSGVNDLSTTHHALAKEWHDSKNELKPTEVVSGSHQYVWWLCKNGHEWKAQIKSRTQGTGCPICAKLSSKD